MLPLGRRKSENLRVYLGPGYVKNFCGNCALCGTNTFSMVGLKQMAANSRFAMGVHALALLASDPERTVTSEEIATGIDTNPVVVRRILSALQEAGLVASQKGPTGGSRLAQPAKKISLADIYQAIEKKPVFEIPYSSSKVKNAHAKKVAGAVKDVFRSADQAVVAELAAISLGQIVKRTVRK